MTGTFYTHDVYTICLLVVLAFSLAALGLAALAFGQRAADRYRPRHARPAFRGAAAITAHAATGREVQVWVPNLPQPIRLRRPRLQLPASTRPPIRFPATDSALEIFDRNMNLIIAKLA